MLEPNLLQEAKARQRCYGRVAAWQAAAALCVAGAAAALAAFVQKVLAGDCADGAVAGPLAALLAFLLARVYFSWRAKELAEMTALEAAETVRLRLLESFCAQGPVALAKERRGELAVCLSEGVEQLEPFFAAFLPRCTAIVATLPVLLVTAFWADGWTALLFLVTAPLLPLFLYLIGSRVARAGTRQWEALSAAGAQFLDLLEGLTTLRLFGQSGAQRQAVEDTGEAFARASLSVLRVAFLSAFALELAATLSIAFVAVSVSVRLLAGQMEFVRAFYVLLLAPEFYLPLQRLGAAFHSAVASSAAARRVYGCLAAPPPAGGTLPFCTPRRVALRFERLSFRYEAARHAVLDSFDLAVPAGWHVAVLGLSGAGKSTLFRLLLQFARPEAGEIYLNEAPLSTLSAADARRCFAYLPQSPHIFAATVAENIALAKRGATQQEIMCAARAACAHDWICALPEGYETRLGAGGRAISGGQARRIALARAFLQDAPVLLLDELTAGLDAVTAREIAGTLVRLKRGKTVLEIAHRLAAARRADEIVVVCGGKVAERGAHEALLTQNGLYAALWTARGRRGA